MSQVSLEGYSITELKNIASRIGLEPKKLRSEIVKQIHIAFTEYENYKKEKIDKYTRISQLGKKGKEGITYLVKNRRGQLYAMKTFRKTKSSQTLKREFAFLKKAGEAGISPKAIEYDTVSKYIVMEKMDCHFCEYIDEKNGVISKKLQDRILEIYSILDDIKIFHNDSNILNYMMKNGQLYIIDFGLSRQIDDRLVKKLKLPNPNKLLALISIVDTFRKRGVPEKSYKYLLKALPEKYRNL